MTSRLRIYLELERLMSSLDETDVVSADAIRDAMDPIWYKLSDQERHVLDERSVGVITSLEGLRVSISHQLGYALERRQTAVALESHPGLGGMKVILGGNSFVDCQTLLAYQGRAVLRVLLAPVRVA